MTEYRRILSRSTGGLRVCDRRPFSAVRDFAIARYLDGGGLDTSFGDGGKLGVDLFAASDGAVGVAIQPDGKIVVGGVARNGASVGGALIRILP